MDNYGGFWWDEFYQPLCVKNFLRSPLSLLSAYIGHLWCDIFGFSILNLRYLVSTETLMAVGIASIFLYRHTHKPLLAGEVFLLASILMKYTSFQLYNWDSGTYLFDSLSICLLVSALSRPTTGKYILLGIAISLMTLGRVPSAIFLPLAITVVCLSLRHSTNSYNSLKASLLIFGAWGAAVILITTLIVGSPLAYLNLFSGENVVSGHSPTGNARYLLFRFGHIFYVTPSHWFPGLLCLMLAIIFPKLRARRIGYALISLAIIFCLAMVYDLVHAESFMPRMLGGDSSLGLGLILSYPVYNIFHNRKGDKSLNLQLWCVFFLYCSMAFGSDGFIERFTAGFSIPVIIAILWQSDITTLRTFIKNTIYAGILIFSVLLTSTLAYQYRNSHKYGILYTTPPFEGIRADGAYERKIARYGEAINYLEAKNIRYSIIDDHHLLELVYGHSNGMNFHEFHDMLYYPHVWNARKASIIPSVDAFVYPVNDSEVDPSVFLDDLKKAGFTDSLRIGETVILSRP